MLPAYPLGEKRVHLKAKALNGLNELNLASKAASKIEWLSGGEAQRVSIVRALINDPSIIIADEPTAHLDTKLSYRFMEIIEKFKAEGKTIIITSHDPLVYDSAMVDQVINLRDGKIEE
jgi:putative ABC transport system ATP-binding protein